jgi:V/A-type H+-transporting ATPase subunit I
VIVNMSKVTLLGMESEREALIKSLMDFGAVEISTIDAEEYEEVAGIPVFQEDLAAAESELSKAGAALESLNKYRPVKRGLFQDRRVVTISEFERINKNRSRVWNAIDRIREQEEHLTALKAEENRLMNLQQSLLPWRGMNVPLETTGTQKTAFQYGTIPSILSWDLIETECTESLPFTTLKRIESDRDLHYFYFVTLTETKEDCLSYLKSRGYNRITFPGLTGTTEENIRKITRRLEKITAEHENSVEQIKKMADDRASIEILYDALAMEKSRIEAAGKVLKTKKAFYIKGWIPQEYAQDAKKSLESAFTVSVGIEQPGEDEEFPVLLKNRWIAEAGEPVSGMYSLPDSREIDPNPVMTPFFVLFFGLMLGDGGYGLILTLLTGFALWRFKLRDNTRKFFKVLFLGGISTIFWGAMFGSWFGIAELVPYALWFDMVTESDRMLGIAFLFGVFHMYTGFAIKAANLIRRKKYLDALMDVGFWLIFYTGLLLFLLPYVPAVDASKVGSLVTVGKYLLITGTVLLIFTAGRNNKYIFTKFFGGLYSLYNAVSFLSDVLSYSRLLALGLATAIIGTIVNDMAFMFDMPGVLKVIVGVLILLAGHTINFAINALGSYVHSCRLQYMEFFGKFFTGGGKPFSPLKANTKYITVKSDAGQ